MFVDSHCHLDRLDPRTHDGDVGAALAAARARGVRQFLAIATTLEGMPGLAALAREHDDVAISAGVHPLHEVPEEPSVEAIMEPPTVMAPWPSVKPGSIITTMACHARCSTSAFVAT